MTVRSHPPCRSPKAALRASNAGFTIIELLVTVTVLGIILAIGLPSLRDFLVRNQVAAIAAEFTNDVSRTRTEAISRNSCVSMCTSNNTQNALTGGTPSCTTANSNWQAGWIIFANPTCSAAITTPNATDRPLITVRQAGAVDFTLAPESGTLQALTFDAKGLVIITQTNLALKHTTEAATSPNYRSLCISSAGRVSVKKYGGSSACP